MKKQINDPSIIFSRFNEDSSWKSKKFKELLNPTEGIRRGPFGSALKKYFVQVASKLFMKSKVGLTSSLCVYALLRKTILKRNSDSTLQ
ncbi:hypothetical protein [Streptococcus sp. Z554]